MAVIPFTGGRASAGTSRASNGNLPFQLGPGVGRSSGCAMTKMETDSFRFTWNVSDFTTIAATCDDLRSPVFVGGPETGHQWELKMNPKRLINGEYYLSVYLILAGFGNGIPSSSTNRKIQAKYKLSIVGPNGQLLKESDSRSGNNLCEFGKESAWGYSRLCAYNELVSQESGYLTDDTLRIHIQVWINKTLKHETLVNGAATAEQRKMKRKEVLASNLGNMFRNSMVPDLTFKVNGTDIPTHKAILAARSSVFERMFNNDMREVGQNQVDIVDFDVEVVRGMLGYIYTGEIDPSLLDERVVDLLGISEKYDLPELKEECEVYMADNLTIPDACSLLGVAHVYNAKYLKEKAIKFINKNKKEVGTTEAFLALQKNCPEVFVELYSSEFCV